MSRITLIILSLFLVQFSRAEPAAKTPVKSNTKNPAQQRAVANFESCEKYVKAFNVYEENLAGKTVENFSVFAVTDWSEDSSFQGFLLTKDAPEKVELRISLGTRPIYEGIASFETWEKDSQYRKANFDPEKFFANVSKAKTFSLEVHAGNHVLCRETKEIIKENE